MRHQGLTLLEVLAVIIVIMLLSALLLPPMCGSGLRKAKQTACASNLQQLYQLGTVYASTHKGEWPKSTGEDLWLSFTKTVPPLVRPDELLIFACPVRGEDPEPGECQYLGPRIPWNQLKPGDPLAADKEGNHGEEYGGNVLFKDGSVMEYGSSDARWKKCREVLSP